MTEQKPSTKERIMQAALELFWHKSVGSVGVERICTQAGVQKGSFYHFFASKDVLISELLHWMEQQAEIHLLKPAFESDRPPTKKFADYMQRLAGQWVGRDYAAEGQSWPGCPMGNLAVELSTQNPEHRAQLCQLMDTHRRYYQQAFIQAQLEGAIPDDISAHDLALLYASLWQGSILIAKTYNDPSIVGLVTKRYLQLLKR